MIINIPTKRMMKEEIDKEIRKEIIDVYGQLDILRDRILRLEEELKCKSLSEKRKK